MIAVTPLLLLLLAIAIAIAVAIAISARRDRARRAHQGPVCAACAYSVVGLTTLTCPECGSDLRTVGILTPAATLRPRQWLGQVIVFTVLLAFVAIIVTPTLVSVMPLRRSYSKDLNLSTPASRAYRQVSLHTRGSTWRTGARVPLPVEIELLANTPGPTVPATNPIAPRMRLHAGGAYEFSVRGARPVVRPNGFGAQAVLDWLKAAGVDTSHPSVPKEAARIAGEARLLARAARRGITADLHAGGFSSSSSGGDSANLFASVSSNERGDRRLPPWAALPFTLLWLVTWLAGLRYLLRGRRRRRPVPTEPAAGRAV